jgi:hypothetical protein
VLRECPYGESREELENGAAERIAKAVIAALAPPVEPAAKPGAWTKDRPTAPGFYYFSTGDQAASVGLKITYTSSSTAATAQTLAVTNQTIGTTPTFQLDYYTSLNQPTAKAFAVRVYQCIGAKQAMQFKLEDFMMPEFEFDFFANASDQVFDMYLPDIS